MKKPTAEQVLATARQMFKDLANQKGFYVGIPKRRRWGSEDEASRALWCQLALWHLTHGGKP